MRHRKASLKLNRTTSHRTAMFRNMVTSLFKHERIRTTGPKAKELRRWADRLITLAKRGDLHARRQALAIVREKQVVHKLFAEANEKFGHSAGGYTRIVKLERRAGDAAPMSMIELLVVKSEGKKKTKKKAAKAKTTSAKKTAAEAKDTKKLARKKDSKTKAKRKSETKKKSGAEAKEETSKPPKTARKKSVTKPKTATKTKAAATAKEKATEVKAKDDSKKKTE